MLAGFQAMRMDFDELIDELAEPKPALGTGDETSLNFSHRHPASRAVPGSADGIRQRNRAWCPGLVDEAFHQATFEVFRSRQVAPLARELPVRAAGESVSTPWAIHLHPLSG